jgi:hypothetical protein
MMSRLFLMLFFVCCFISCSDRKPKDILPEAKMENIIWDMVQADEFISTFVQKDSAKVNVAAERYKAYERVFAIHNINRAQFKKSYDYYAARPGFTRKIFDSLSSKSQRRIQDTYKKMEVQ